MMSGSYLRQHGQTDFRNDVSSFEVSGFGSFPYQLDGDYVGDVEELTVQHEPQKLRIYVPN
jgi:diacylglycerol kinase family enzyme